MRDDVFIRLVKLPSKCHAMVVKGDDGYNIYVNDALNYEMQQKACEHEMDHIDCDDFGKSVNECEFKEE